MTPIAADEVASSLLQYNFLPRQRKSADELPPVFSSEGFTWDIAKQLLLVSTQKGGYDAVDVGQTRADGNLRMVSIPHPLPYAHLVGALYQGWPNLIDICTNQNSRLRPRMHKDGRIFVMNYGDWKTKKIDRLSSNFGKKFLVRADIANFFGSIYTHAFPWSVAGVKESKTSKGKSNWYNDIDNCLQNCRRRETNGILIGPGASNIIAEAMLKGIDKELSKFDFVRYIDDYICYAETQDEAEDFLRMLEKSLRTIKLHLNHRKTKIERLHQSTDSEWVIEARQLIKFLPKELRPSDAIDALDRALLISKKYNDPNVLKYILRALGKAEFHFYTPSAVIEYCLSIVVDYPCVFSVLSIFFEKANGALSDLIVREKLYSIIKSSLASGRTDMALWSIYYLGILKIPISNEIFQDVIFSRDCMVILMSYKYGTTQQKNEVINFAKRAVSASDNYDRNKYWILIYELFFINKITKISNDKKTFEILKNSGVSFLI